MPAVNSTDASGDLVGHLGLFAYDASSVPQPVSVANPLPIASGAPAVGTASVIVKTATATALGDTALWTPAAGKRFRLQKCKFEIPADASLAAGGDLDILFRDSTTAIGVAGTVFIPTAAGTTFGAYQSGWIDLGTGYLSTTINNVLNINLSVALATGKVRVLAVGTEE